MNFRPWTNLKFTVINLGLIWNSICVFSLWHAWHVSSGASRCIPWVPPWVFACTGFQLLGGDAAHLWALRRAPGSLALAKRASFWILPKRALTSPHVVTSFCQKRFIEHLLYARFWTRNWGHNRAKDRLGLLDSQIFIKALAGEDLSLFIFKMTFFFPSLAWFLTWTHGRKTGE